MCRGKLPCAERGTKLKHEIVTGGGDEGEEGELRTKMRKQCGKAY